MNLSLSNFAWEFNDIENVANILHENKINNIELIFTKYKNWSEINERELIKLKNLLNSYNLSCSSSQSLFYNVDCESIISESDKFISHVKKIINYSKILGIKVLVFGSPTLRKIDGVELSNLHETFKKIDLLLEGTEIIFCIEPNSRIYGGDFFYTIEEIVLFLKMFKYNNIFTMCDTHNSWLENKNPNEELVEFLPFIKHIHISEPKLTTIDLIEKHIEFSESIKKTKYNNIITYEVLSSENTLKSVNTFSSIYTLPFINK